jgi:TetR/AcrR family transcriptional regulator, cholesterol catabolism regulator
MSSVPSKTLARAKKTAARAQRPPRPKSGNGARQRGRPAGSVLDRRDLILTAALKLFAVQGYERTGLKDIARATGITHPAIYYYYRSKGQLLFEAVTFALGQLVSRLRQVDPGNFHKQADYLRTLVRINSLFEVELRGVTPFINTVLYGPLRDLADLTTSQKNDLRKLQRDLVEIYRKVLAAGAASGELAVRSTAVTAFSILGMVSHLAVWYRDDGELSSDAVANLMAELAHRLVLDSASHSRR